MRRRRALQTGLAAAGTALAGCAWSVGGAEVTRSFDDSYDVSPETVLAVRNRNGDVTLRAADGDRLAVSGVKRASSEAALDTMTVDVVTGEQFVVEVRFESGSEFASRSVDLTVEVPDGVTVDRAATANGNVQVEAVAGDLVAGAGNGTVTVRDVDGFVRAETTNGDVTVRRTTGLHGARTTNGSVRADVYAIREDVTCRTTNGDVTVGVGPDVAAAVRLATDRGEVAVRDLPHTVETSRPGALDGHLRGASEPLLRLVAQNGDVTLRPAPA